MSSRRPSEDRRRPSEVDFIPTRRSEDNYGTGRTSEDNYTASVTASSSSRRKQSQDNTRRSDDRDRDYGRRPSGAASVSGTSDSTSTANAAQSTTATSGMIIPNKSTIEEEYIEVPYGRDARESGSTTIDERERSRETSQDASLIGGLTDGEHDSASDYPSPLSPRSPPAGLSGLSARLKGVDDDEDDGATSGHGGRSGDDSYDKLSYGRSSVNSDRSVGGIGSRVAGGRASVSDDQEKMRRDYEYKIATMQTQITNLQRDLGDAGEKERKWKDGEARVRQMEEELVGLRRVSTNLVPVEAFVDLSANSVLRSRALRCVPSRKSLMNCERSVNGRKSARPVGSRMTRKRCKFYGIVASVSRKNEKAGRQRQVKLSLVHYTALILLPG